MSFIWPEFLFLLLLSPLAVFYYLRIQHQRQLAAARMGNLGLIKGFGGISPGFRRFLPAIIYLLAVCLFIFGLARPQAVVSLPRVEGQIILGFDVSGSMAANDLEPNRLEAAKKVARSFVERQPQSVQIGVVSFSDNGFTVQAPTNDKDAILASINRIVPQRGTSLGNGIASSLSTIALALDPEPATSFYTNLTPAPSPTPTPFPQGTFSSASIILLTDGENNETPDPLEAAQIAANRGVRIYTIGVGSPTGANLQLDGFTVHTRLDEELLKQISDITNGAYYHAADENDLQKIYDNLTPQLIVKTEKTEITSIVAGAGLFLLVIGGALSLYWFNRLP